MPEFLEGDEWKRATYPAYPPAPDRRTRAEAQAAADRDFALARIDVAEYRKLSAEYGDPERWNAKGKRK